MNSLKLFLLKAKVLEELRAEIAKGWDGPLSDRSVADIVKAKIA